MDKGMRKPPGFWKREEVKTVIKAVLDKQMLVRDAAEKLDTTEQNVHFYVYCMAQRRCNYDPDRRDLERRRGSTSLVHYNDLDRAIDWANFFGLDRPEPFDLRVICAMFYASERIIIRCATATRTTHELADVRNRSRAYIATWAERFGKYTLAACLGEFRHRKQRGTVRLVPMKRGSGTRAAAQRAAMLLWPHPEKAATAIRYLVEKFTDPRFFPGGSFGGRRWSRIAKTLESWHAKQIPDVVFADYVWDLSHNGGQFFDKCELFQNEHLVRQMLTLKAEDAVGQIGWGRQFLHPDWARGLDLVEIANAPVPDWGGAT